MAMYIPHADQAPRRQTNTLEAPRRETRRGSIIGDGAPRRRPEEEEEIHPCPMPARFMHFFRVRTRVEHLDQPVRTILSVLTTQ
jgi:hypothetical protein